MSGQRLNVLLLGVFSACLIGAAGLATYIQLQPDNEPTVEEIVAAELNPDDLPPISGVGLEAPAQSIVDRDLFAPVRRDQRVVTPEPGSQRTVVAGAEDLSGTWMPPMVGGFAAPPAGTAGWGPAPTQPAASPPAPMAPSGPVSFPPPAPTRLEAPPVSEAPARPEPRIAITGVTSAGGTTRVLVEDVNTGKRSWVAPGDSAYGFRVDYATGRGAVVSRDGHSEVLRVGENKGAGAAEAAPKPSAPAANGTEPGE